MWHDHHVGTEEKLGALTSADESESWLAYVIAVGVAFDGERGDVVKLSGVQAL